MQVEGEYRIIDNAKSTAYELSKFSQTFSSLKEPSVDYPELIYDGPFSDSVLNKEVKGLTYEEVTQVEADEIVKKMKDKLKFVSFEQAGETNGNIPSYNYKLRFSDDSRAYMQLTKSGGKLLSYSRMLEIKPGKQDQEKYAVNAVEFATNVGFENIESVWIEESKDGVYINLTSKINDVKAKLAYEVTKMVHGEEEAEKAHQAAIAIFSAGTNSENMPSFELEKAAFGNGMNILDLLVAVKLVPSKGEGRRLVQQGGISLDGEKITDVSYIVDAAAFDKGEVVIKKGKKVFLKVVLV